MADPPSGGSPPAAPGVRARAWSVLPAEFAQPLVPRTRLVWFLEAPSPGNVLAHSPTGRVAVGDLDAGSVQSLPQLAMLIGDPSMPAVMPDTSPAGAAWPAGTHA